MSKKLVKRSTKKSGKGSHGSISKAGKVRNSTPKEKRTAFRKRFKFGPKVRNRIEYNIYLDKLYYQGKKYKGGE